MSFKDVLMWGAILLLGARFQSTEVFEGTWNEGFHNGDVFTLQTESLYGIALPLG